MLVKQGLHSERHAMRPGLACSTQRLAPLRSRWQSVRRPSAACTELCGNLLATSTFSPNASGADNGRTSSSLSEELYDGSDVIRVTFWQTAGLPPRGSLGEHPPSAMTHETRSACFGVPAEVQKCETVQAGLSFVLESFLMSSPILEPQLAK